MPSNEEGKFQRGNVPVVTLLLLLGVYVLLSVTSLWSKSVTVDEYAHLPAGCAAARHGSLDLYGKTPPLARYFLAAPALALSANVPVPQLPTRGGGWDPWVYGDVFVDANAGPEGLGNYEGLLRGARLAGVLMGGALLVIVFVWGRRLFGPAGGTLAAFLLALSPTFLAHARLATVDVGATLAITVALALGARALSRGGVPAWAAAGAAVGAALAAKFTAFLLLPVLAVAALVSYRRGLRAPSAAGWRRRLASPAAFLGMLWLILLLVYQFDDLGRRVDAFPFESRMARAVAGALPGWAPVPLPGALVRGMDGQLLDLQDAEMPNYLNGQWSRRGWWSYYPEALLLKTPLALWGMVALALLLAIRRQPWQGAGKAPPGERSVALLVLGLWAAALFVSSLASHLDIGIRYLLPAFPAALLLLAGALGRVVSGKRWQKLALLALVVSYAGATVSAHPHYLPFFNLLAGGAAGGGRYLANSNNDWGQDLPLLARWLEEEGIEEPIYLAYFGHLDPARYGIDYRLPPDHLEPGIHVISLNLLLGFPYVVVDHGSWVLLGEDLVRPQHEYAWLRGRTPETRLGESLWVFRVEHPEKRPGL